jgi:hypothetical protein
VAPDRRLARRRGYSRALAAAGQDARGVVREALLHNGLRDLAARLPEAINLLLDNGYRIPSMNGVQVFDRGGRREEAGPRLR